MRRIALLLTLAASCAAHAADAPRSGSAPASAEGIRVLLAPALETTLVSQMNGRVAALQVGLGDRFARGQALVRLDCEEQQARLRMSEAEYAAARETHEAKIRLQGLQQASELEVSTAASTAARARAQIDLQRVQLAYCTVGAPFAGRVVKLGIKPHQGVAQGQALLEIVGDGPLKLRLNAPAKWVAWLKPGTPFEVAIDETGKRYKARVTALNGRVDAVSQTIELEGAIADRAPELLPGMSGSAHFAPPN